MYAALEFQVSRPNATRPRELNAYVFISWKACAAVFLSNGSQLGSGEAWQVLGQASWEVI